jgi:prophage regulatory protein
MSTSSADTQINSSRILRLPEVILRTGLPRASIYQQMALGSFPKPIPLSTRSRGWIESEIQTWIEQRILARSGSEEP